MLHSGPVIDLFSFVWCHQTSEKKIVVKDHLIRLKLYQFVTVAGAWCSALRGCYSTGLVAFSNF
jgi:hypothetical protein